MAYSRQGYFTENPLMEIKKYFKDKNLLEIRSFKMANLKRIDRMAYCYPLLIKSRVICNCDGKTRPTEKGPYPMK